jgi:sec-independent protein translocase protein TatB
MLDVGLSEIVVASAVGLIVLGPERLPEAIRWVARHLHYLKNGFRQARTEFDREMGLDDLRRDLHNESLMRTFQDETRKITKDLNEQGRDPR